MKRVVVPALFVLPCLTVLAIFIYWPIFYSFYLSLHDVNLLSGRQRFVGAENFVDLALDDGFHRSVAITATFVVASVPLRLALALFLAQLLVAERPANRVLRGVFFLPYVSSTVAIAVVWSWLFNTDLGLINLAIGALGGSPQNWLYDADTALYAVAAVNVWKQLGYDMVIFIAGLQAISPTLYEAARIDGASRLHQFRTITLPLLTPTLLFLLVISVIDSFQVFTLVNVMTRGGPALSTDVIVNFFYRLAFVRLDYGSASAVVIALFLFLLGLTILQFGVLGRKVSYDLD
ncbi:MAG: sugar ABC transporter permease [Pseudomonadota bacterium]